jgi:hypothetical protein
MFGNLLKSAAYIALLPATAVADVVTLGGVLTDREKSYSRSAVDAAEGAFDAAMDDE